MALKRNTRIFLSIVLVGVLVVAGTTVMLSSSSSSKSGKMSVVASFYPLYYFSSEIGKDRVEASMLIPDNSEPHSWEPSPSDIRKVNDADVLVYNGQGFEPWMDAFLGSADNPDLVLVDTSKNVSLHMSVEVREVYEAAMAVLGTGTTSEVTATASADSATTVDANGFIAVNLVPISGGNGGYIKVQSMDGGDLRFFVTNATSFTITSPDGTEVASELDNGKVSWYPMFNGSKFVELEAGTAYDVSFGPSDSDGTGLIIVAGQEGSTEGGEEHHHGLNDPHFWLDPLSAKVQVDNILQAFVHTDPGNATFYEQNAADLNSRLDALNQEFVDGLSGRNKNAIITTHEGFDYLAERYGFEAYAAIGISADSQPSAQDLADLADMVRELDLKYVYSEPIFSDSVMETIASETGTQVLVLDGIHGRSGVHAGMDYFQIMRANLEALKIGLEVPS